MKVNNETKVGALAAISITILVLGYNYLRGSDIFSQNRSFYAVYNKIEGLKASNAVQINGLTVGSVSNLNLMEDNTGRVLVKFMVMKGFNIPDNTIARIVSADLLGDKSIVLNLGNSNNYASSGDTLSSDVQKSIMDEVNSTVAPLKIKSEKLLQSIDSMVTVMQYFLSDKNRQNFDKSLNSMEHTVRVITTTVMRIDTLVKVEAVRMDHIMANVQSITGNLKDNNDNLGRILSNSADLTDSLKQSNLISAVNEAEKGIAALSETLDKLNDGKGTAGLLLNDDKLYHSLSKAGASMDSLMVDLKKYPSRYIPFKGKDKRERKEIRKRRKEEKDARRQGN